MQGNFLQLYLAISALRSGDANCKIDLEKAVNMRITWRAYQTIDD